MNKYAVIVAGGSGSRMGASIPKQFLPILGKPALAYTLSAFLSAYTDMQIILVLPAEHIQRGKEILALFPERNRISIVEGGVTRFESVKKGLFAIKAEAVVFVHDGVRCLVSEQLIRRCYEQTLVSGSAIPAVSSAESVRILKNGQHEQVNREAVFMIQTPQTFLSAILLPAFEQEEKENFTDEASVVEASGQKVFLTEGEYSNIKITRPIDLLIAERILEGNRPL